MKAWNCSRKTFDRRKESPGYLRLLRGSISQLPTAPSLVTIFSGIPVWQCGQENISAVRVTPSPEVTLNYS